MHFYCENVIKFRLIEEEENSRRNERRRRRREKKREDLNNMIYKLFSFSALLNRPCNIRRPNQWFSERKNSAAEITLN